MDQEYQKQFDAFHSDIAKHAVSVLRDDGLYRHLRCSSGGYAYSFDVITWPGYLCYAGDMGCFVFTRLPDMFEFFRGRRTALIDRGYLAEKAVAADKHDGLRQYSENRFQSAVKDDVDSFVEANQLSEADAAQLWQSVEDMVLLSGDNVQDAIAAASGFRWAPNDLGDTRGQEVFPDFWEHELEDYTSRFVWCCYAVPWAIEQYDAIAAAQDHAQPETVAAVRLSVELPSVPLRA